MIDPYVLLTPVLLLAVFALLRFVGCDKLFGINAVQESIAAPSNLRVQAGIDARVTLSWDDDPRYSYLISRTPPFPQDPVSLPQPPYVDTAVMIGTTYDYKVKATDPTGESLPAEALATPGPITWVQGGAPAENFDNSGATTDTVFTHNPASIPTPGDLMVVWVYYNIATEQLKPEGGPDPGVADAAGNTYKRAIGPTDGTGALAGWRQEIWYGIIANAGPNLRITAKFTNPFNQRKRISAIEYQFANSAEPFEDAAGQAATSASPATNLVVTTAARLAFGAAIFSGASGGTPGPGFNVRSTLLSNIAEDMDLPGPSSYAATFAVNPLGIAQAWIAQVVMFK